MEVEHDTAVEVDMINTDHGGGGERNEGKIPLYS